MTVAPEFSRTGRRCVGGWQGSERWVLIGEFDSELGGAEVGGTQIDNLEYSLSQSCNCAILPTERGNKRAFLFSPIFCSSSLQSVVSKWTSNGTVHWPIAGDTLLSNLYRRRNLLTSCHVSIATMVHLKQDSTI